MSDVKLYGFIGCPYCDELKLLYDKNKIKYDFIDIYDETIKDHVDKLFEIAKNEVVPIILIDKQLLVPEDSFNTIDEAFDLTIEILKNKK